MINIDRDESNEKNSALLPKIYPSS